MPGQHPVPHFLGTVSRFGEPPTQLNYIDRKAAKAVILGEGCREVGQRLYGKLNRH